ncbi:hypothetical protein ACLI4Z_15440 [Natrialbaceae archaeon A-arb3/5]
MSDETPDWMEPVDEEILELLRSDEIFSPSHINDEGVCRAPHAAHRCRELTDRGLLKKYMEGMYELTDRGERFLDGDVDPADLE